MSRERAIDAVAEVKNRAQAMRCNVSAEELVDAAYPLIRSQLCQELAEALREKGQFSSRAEEAFGFPHAAEFVESWATEGGEDG